MSIESNAKALARAWTKRPQQFEREMGNATREATKTLLSISKSEMTKLIYDKPVPSKAEIQAERMGKQADKGRDVTRIKGMKAGYKGGFVNYKFMHLREENKPAWKRTGNLRRSERMAIASTYVGLVINDAKSKTKKGKTSPYAYYRHEKKCRYPAPWRANAIKKARPLIQNIYRLAMRRALYWRGSMPMAAGGGG